MALPTEIENQLIRFLKHKIEFNTNYNQFTFNEEWLIDITEDKFKAEALDILLKVNNHLNVGLKNKEFLHDLIALLDCKINWFESNDINNILKIAEFIKTIKSNTTKLQAPRREKYDIEFILSDDLEVERALIFEDNYYFHLRQHATYFNNYEQSIFMEGVKLNYVLKLYYEYLIKIYRYFDNLLINFESINFSEYQFEYQLAKTGFIEEKKNMHLKRLCHVNLNKKDTAVLFMILMDEKIFEFDKNEMKNKVAMQKFIENNFSYRGEKDSRTPIKNIKQSFSDIIIPKEVNQLEFIDELISILQLRKGRIEK